jgi:hypothetical protein
MTPRAQLRLLVGCWVGSLFALGLLVDWELVPFLVGMGVIFVVLQWRIWNIRCLHCGARLKPQQLWIPFLLRRCKKCGTPTNWKPKLPSKHRPVRAVKNGK